MIFDHQSAAGGVHHDGAGRRTITRHTRGDRGLEMAKHKAFTVATDVKVYFCDPQSLWQRGTNENADLLLRQYFPRGTDLVCLFASAARRGCCVRIFFKLLTSVKA